LLLQRVAWDGPVIGGFYRRLTVSRLARTLGALLANGVTLSDALAVVTRAETNRLVQDGLARVSQEVAAGAPVSKALGENGLFPGRAVQVLRVGEETGGLDAMFGRVAETFESETKREIETLLSLLEPALILAMACGVAFVVLAMLLPVLSLNNLAM
jgi:type II secretory pathway component PulF